MYVEVMYLKNWWQESSMPKMKTLVWAKMARCYCSRSLHHKSNFDKNVQLLYMLF